MEVFFYRPARGCRLPARAPQWVSDVGASSGALVDACGRSPEQEAGAAVREVLPRLAAEAVAERLAHDTNAAEPGALAPGSPRDLSLNAALSVSPGGPEREPGGARHS